MRVGGGSVLYCTTEYCTTRDAAAAARRRPGVGSALYLATEAMTKGRPASRTKVSRSDVILHENDHGGVCERVLRPHGSGWQQLINPVCILLWQIKVFSLLCSAIQYYR